jgi:SAM-dependent methyltransferase
MTLGYHFMYVCPHCKGPLVELTCRNCGSSYQSVEGIPCFLTGSSEASHHKLSEIYDDIYTHHKDVWIDQGRSQRFQSWFSELATSFSIGPLLEIGCGEGFLLSTFRSETRFGIDLSFRALMRARQRSNAECAVARAEELPFPPEAFDVIASVGVMEHFENPDVAIGEICRVLKQSGHYVALIHTDMTRAQRFGLKVKEFLLPLPRPIALLKWVRKKLLHPITQPLRKSYTVERARALLEHNGLNVIQIITHDSDRSAPLAGRHVVIFVAKKPVA